ncbi:SRPBCC family protein [Pseudarthrobacter sp. L1SW]|uniref:SRPBCC family protein n=1 Tax=Pseudarthrobacter sp. L1SW TaxID=2851598 RepID=UPI001E2FC307|nr:SRPBCC family protein [Pseudarthrobacter sp. L1SW]UEL30531.1 SRPBCC family protein [Pseudarthrobacter sp. L1SW]
MSTKVEKRIVVDVPVSTAYNQWTQFEEFPRFMGGVESVTRLGNDRLKWVAHIGGVRRHWEAKILEQLPGRRVAWAAIEGVTNSGAVDFRDAGNNRTELALTLEYQPAGVVERVGNLLHVVGRQAEHDLKKFKEFIEHQSRRTAEAGTGAPAESPAPAEAAAPAEPQPYNRFAHPFDQTGGLVDLEGESDETAEGESYSSAERRARRRGGNLPPVDGSLGQH